MEQGAAVSAPATWDAVVVGAGLAGLAATASLAEAGKRVLLLEWRPYLGGRAYSYVHPALDMEIDSQHVLLGCCTNVSDMMARAGAAETIRWYDALTFLEPGGRRTELKPGVLPAPMHQTMSFLQAPMLGVGDKVAIARGLLEFFRGYPARDDGDVASWLRRTGQTERAVRHFWEPVLVGALNDSFAHCSLKYAGKVFHESFLRSAAGGRLGIPAAPLSDFFAPVLRAAERAGAEARFGAKVTGLRREGAGWVLALADGAEERATGLVLATNPEQADTLGRMAGLGGVTGGMAERIVRAPITTIHLWYDEPVTELEHAALLDTRIQWVFHKSRLRRRPAVEGSYLELTISDSKAELRKDRETLVAESVRELGEFFPEARRRAPRQTAVLKEAKATFSVVPGMDAVRPGQRTGYEGLVVAGDWTRTEWPSTMEGAVRSGRLAAGELVDARERFLTPELPRGGLMRWLAKAEPGAVR